MSNFEQQLEKIKTQPGFIAALDQSGGSTPKALRLYGIPDDAWSNDDEMFAVVHEMRTRIMTSPAFNGDRILGAILFENTMDRDVSGQTTADYLWDVKNVVPFLKVDQGLADEQDGVQIMKPMPDLDALLEKAGTKNIFGTKMRSVIKQANQTGIEANVKQQFEIGRRIVAAGFVPIIEPEVDIHCPDKAQAEAMMKAVIMDELESLDDDAIVMLKLTLPEEDNLFRDCIEHPNVARVVALSGGYTREEANARLARQNGMVASFSRALAEGLTAQQSDDDFNAMLDASIQSIFDASSTRGAELGAVERFPFPRIDNQYPLDQLARLSERFARTVTIRKYTELDTNSRWSGRLLEAGALARVDSTAPDIDPAMPQATEPLVPKVYVSYAWARERRDPLVDELCDALAEQGRHIDRDSTDQQPGDLISHFMGRLSTGRCVIVVLSEAYLRSEFCMTELYQLYTNARHQGNEFLRRIVPVVLDDARIGSPRERIAHAVHWQDEHEALDFLIRKHGAAVVGLEDFRRFKLIGEFYRHVSDILVFANDILLPRDRTTLSRDGFALVKGLIDRALD